jgi:DNA-binding transcriptional ArsR family regulator
METERGLEATAALFKVLGSQSRLHLLRILASEPATVGSLATLSGMSQPLVSQHLRTLRFAGIVAVSRTGREALYALADHHIAHVVDDALAHVLEEQPEQPGAVMSITEIHAEHTVTEHQHGSDCGHEAVQHDDHTDYVHGTHHHSLHDDHYDEHESVAEHSTSEHAHGAECGHETVDHDGHVDFIHDGHKHAAHGEHYDEH